MPSFRCIRYARAERFCPPQMVDGVEFGPLAVCPQRLSRLSGLMGSDGALDPLSEDCLRLSIFTPSCDGSHPVMVWIHGGSFITGSGEFPRYDASRLADEGNIVVVNVSYRIGALGMGGLGLADQACALEWVHRFIAQFGGDPDRIVLCGQSAGAYSVACHIQQGRARFFRKAIMFSAPFSLGLSKNDADRVRRKFRRFLGKDEFSAGIDEILAAQARVLRSSSKAMPFCPVLENSLVKQPASDGACLTESVLLTWQKDDAMPFCPSRLLVRPATEMIFHRPLVRYAEALRASGVNVDAEMFSWHPKGNPMGACHTLEVPFLFGSWDDWNAADMLSGCSEEEFEARAAVFRKKIIDFINH